MDIETASRTFACTGNRTIDITFLGLPASPAIDLAAVLDVEFIGGDGSPAVTWATSTNLSLVVTAGGGIVYRTKVGLRKGTGLGVL